MEKLRTVFETGKYTDYVESLQKEIETLSGLDKKLDVLQLVNEEKSRLRNSYFYFSLSGNQKSTVDDFLRRINQTPPSKNWGVIGVAYFPVASDDHYKTSIAQCSVKKGSFDWKDQLNAKLIGEESKTPFAAFMIFLEKKIQEQLYRHKFNNQKYFILNWELELESTVAFNGNSFLFAAYASFISRIINKPIPITYYFTGSFKSDGNAERIGELDEKIRFISEQRPGFEKLFIPKENEEDVESLTISDEVKEKIVFISDFQKLHVEIFGSSFVESFNEKILKNSIDGRQFISISDEAEQSVTLTKRSGEKVTLPIKPIVIDFKSDRRDRSFFIYPPTLPSLEWDQNGPKVILLNGTLANKYTMNLISNSLRNVNAIIAVRQGSDVTSPFAIVFSQQNGFGEEYIGATFEFIIS